MHAFMNECNEMGCMNEFNEMQSNGMKCNDYMDERIECMHQNIDE